MVTTLLGLEPHGFNNRLAINGEVALNRLRADGVEVKAEDVARLSPPMHEHINMLGRYHFTLAEPIIRGELRPLCDPNDPNRQEFAA